MVALKSYCSTRYYALINVANFFRNKSTLTKSMTALSWVLFSLLLSTMTFAQAPVDVQFYVMSKCPFAAALTQNFHDNVYTSAGLPGIMNITYNYIAQVCSDQPTGFCSKHGQDEVTGDWIELCVNQLNHNQLFPFIYCSDQNYGSIPTNMPTCASQLNIPYPPVQSCVTTSGKALLVSSIAATNKLGIQYSPNLFINGQCVYGSLSTCTNLDPTTNMIRAAICQAYTGQKPAGCSA